MIVPSIDRDAFGAPSACLSTCLSTRTSPPLSATTCMSHKSALCKYNYVRFTGHVIRETSL